MQGRPGLRIEDQKKLIKFEDVRQTVAEEHALKNSDITLEMDKLRITPELNVEIPRLGVFTMTDWSKRQLGQILGVQWDKWFDPKLVDYRDVQTEVQKRFSRTRDTRKLRTKRFRLGAPGVDKCDGYLRAVLSPTYHSIDDERVFDRIDRRFASRVSNLAFMKNHLNKTATWGNDHCSYYTIITKEPVDLGPINRNHENPQVRHIYDLAEREGKLPESDYIYPGIQVRNSEVGYTALVMDEFTFRLVCLNGAIVCVGDSRLMYRQHRPIETELLDKHLNEVFDKLPVRWEITRKNYGILASIPVENPDQVITKHLEKLEAPKTFQEAAIKAFQLEPLPNMYGVLQAVTRAAQTYSEDMDKRFDLEALAGRLLHMAPRLQAAA